MLQLVHPLSVTLGLLALAIVALVLRRRGTGTFLVILAFGWTYALATPYVAHTLRADLERRFSPTPVAQLPEADAIVVLGGGVEPQAEPRNGPNLLRAADRVWYAARAFKAGKAPLVIATGRRPYTNAGPTAAEAQAEVLTTLGVPREAIVAPGESVRTRTDAEVVKRVLEERDLGQVILVTSAQHMTRAFATFQALGVRAYPAPTDFEVVEVPYRDESAWLPSTEAFLSSSRAIRERLAIAWYRYEGWI